VPAVGGSGRCTIVRRSGLLGLALSLALAGSASASTICVGGAPAPCDSTKPSIGTAFGAASPGDVVKVGSGTYSESGLTQPFGVRLVGFASPGARPQITAPAASGVTLLTINPQPTDTNPTVTNFDFVLPAGASNVGLTLQENASADQVSVSASGGVTLPIGVHITGGVGADTERLSHATITLPGAPVSSTGVDAGGNGVQVEDSTISADTALLEAGGTLNARRLNLTGAKGVQLQASSDLTANVEDSLIRVADTSAGNATRWGVRGYEDGSGATANVDLSNLTILPPSMFNPGDPGGAGVEASANSGGVSHVRLHDSIVRGFHGPQMPDLFSFDFSGGTNADLTVDHSDFSFVNAFGTTPGPGNLNNVDPMYVSQVTGDFRLASTSPLIDAGSTTAPTTGETDLGGQQRLLVGKQGCVLARDMGAYEFQAGVTFARATVPAVVQIGNPANFDAGTSCGPDPSLTPLHYSWSFDDGASAGDSPTASHVFTTGGTHTGTVTVRDSEMRTSQATATVRVNRPPSPVALVSPDPAVVGQPVQFDGSKSTDDDPGDTLTYSWSFDDGTTETGASFVDHTFDTTGVHQGTLTVTDSSGAARTATATVTVNPPPPPPPPQREKPVPPVEPPLVPIFTGPVPEAVTPPMRVKESVNVANGTARVMVAAPGDIPGIFDVRVLLQAHTKTSPKGSAPKQRKAAAAAVTMGSARAKIPAGETRIVKIRLSRRGQALMRRAPRHRLRGTLVIRAQVGTAAPRTTRTPVTMRS
jgi:PKD repeat protein